MNRINRSLIKLLFVSVIGLAVSLFLFSCEEVKPEDGEIVFKTQKKTVLIYMATNNNLSDDAISNLESLKEGFIPVSDNLLVYMHTYNSNPYLIRLSRGLNGVNSSVTADKKEMFAKLTKNGPLVIDTLYKFPANTISASAKTVTSVMNIVKTMCPAEKYGLIVSSHGTGWLPKGYFTRPYEFDGTESAMCSSVPEIDPYAHMVKSFGSEMDSKAEKLTEMEVVDFAKAIPYNLEFLIFDACFMGQMEVAYEFKDKVKYFIGSPSEILALGFPYKSIAQFLFKDEVDITSVAKTYFEFYNAMSGDYQSASIGAFAMDGLKDVADAAKVIFDKHRDSIPTLDRTDIQKYFRMNKHWFYDLEDYMKALTGGDSDFDNFKRALEKVTLYKNATKTFLSGQIVFNRTCGISTYITEDSKTLTDAYKKLAWNKDVQMILE